MADSRWNDELLTGDAMVDEQHRTLFEMVERFADALDAGGDGEAVADTLYEVLVYAEDHFRDEEALMERIDYPGLESQRRMHAAFAADAKDMARAFIERHSVTGPVLLDYLTDWLDNHVRTQDMALARFLAAEKRDSED